MAMKFFFTGLLGLILSRILARVFYNPFPRITTKAEIVTGSLLIISLLDIIISGILWIWM